MYAVSTSENTHGCNHHAQQREDEVEVVAEDCIKPSRIARHQVLFHACSWAMNRSWTSRSQGVTTATLGRSLPWNISSCGGNGVFFLDPGPGY